MIIHPSPSGTSVLPIPCDHPAAPDSAFYCVPSYFNSPHMHDHIGFVLVDTQKVIAELKKNNPQLMQHAEYKFRGETVEGWLKHTDFQPRDMGYWVYGRGRPLAMSSGQASLIKVAELLKLPCFPVAIHKTELNEVEGKFGYTGGLSLRPTPKTRSGKRDYDWH